MALVDRPLSVRDSLAGLLAVFRLMDAQLGIDREATTVRIMVAGPNGEELAAIRLSDLIHRADAALGVADMASRNPDVPGEHSPLPWRTDDNPDEPLVIRDATGVLVARIESGMIPTAEALATLAFLIRAANAFPLLITTVQTAVSSLRSYQYGNEAPDLAREIADACEVVLAQMEGR